MNWPQCVCWCCSRCEFFFVLFSSRLCARELCARDRVESRVEGRARPSTAGQIDLFCTKSVRAGLPSPLRYKLCRTSRGGERNWRASCVCVCARSARRHMNGKWITASKRASACCDQMGIESQSVCVCVALVCGKWWVFSFMCVRSCLDLDLWDAGIDLCRTHNYATLYIPELLGAR